MREIGKSDRLVCETKCILNFDGFEIQGVIENISLSGALIKLNDKPPDSIRPGDTCDMVFSDNPDLYPIKYTSKIVRLDSEILGIEFLELNIL
jgi:PilZ domain